MVEIGIALLGTLAAMAATGLLVMRTFQERQTYLAAWSATLFGLCVALGGMTVGFMTGFAPKLFRAVELGGALIAPLWLALGVVELVARSVPAKFGSRLVVASYSIVAVVIVLVDPLTGSFDASLPDPGDHYTWLPLALIAGGHMLAIGTLVACAVVVALRAKDQDPDALAILLPVALVALAGVLVVAATRGFLPGALAAMALGAATGLVWYGGSRPLTPARRRPGDEEVARQRGRRRARPASVRPDRPVAGDRDALPPMPPPPPPAPPETLYGQITVYTLLDGRERAFDRLAEDTVRAVRQSEPDALIFACHSVANAPNQRIFYQLFRDRAAYDAHQKQPHVMRFLSDGRPHWLTTNVIELKLNAAKVTPLPGAGPAEPALPPRTGWDTSRPDTSRLDRLRPDRNRLDRPRPDRSDRSDRGWSHGR